MTEELKRTTVQEAVELLQAGETVIAHGKGNSMTPKIKSGEDVIVEPLALTDSLSKGDIVIAKVKGRTYLHLVKAIKGEEVQIGNNHGHVNGWTPRDRVYGRYVRKA